MCPYVQLSILLCLPSFSLCFGLLFSAHHSWFVQYSLSLIPCLLFPKAARILGQSIFFYRLFHAHSYPLTLPPATFGLSLVTSCCLPCHHTHPHKSARSSTHFSYVRSAFHSAPSFSFFPLFLSWLDAYFMPKFLIISTSFR